MNARNPGLNLMLFFQRDKEGVASVSTTLSNILGQAKLAYQPCNSEAAEATRTFLKEGGDTWNRLPDSQLLRFAAEYGSETLDRAPFDYSLVQIFVESDSAIVIWSLRTKSEVVFDTTRVGWYADVKRAVGTEDEWKRAMSIWNSHEKGGVRNLPGLFGGVCLVDLETDPHDIPDLHTYAKSLACALPNEQRHIAGGVPCQIGTGAIAVRRLNNVVIGKGSNENPTFFDEWLLLERGYAEELNALANLLAYGRANEIPLITRYQLHAMKCRYYRHEVTVAKNKLRQAHDEIAKISQESSTLPPSSAETMTIPLLGTMTQYGSEVQDQARRRETIRLAAYDCTVTASWLTTDNPPRNCIFAADHEFLDGAILQAEAAYEYARASYSKLMASVELFRVKIELTRQRQELERKEIEEEFSRRIHLLEVFIVGFYVFHLAHILTEWHAPIYVLALVPLVAGAVTILFMTQNWRTELSSLSSRLGTTLWNRHSEAKTSDHGNESATWSTLLWVAILILIAVGAAILNPTKHPEPHEQTVPKAAEADHVPPAPSNQPEAEPKREEKKAPAESVSGIKQEVPEVKPIDSPESNTTLKPAPSDPPQPKKE